jgi:ankyrin repeat protein
MHWYVTPFKSYFVDFVQADSENRNVLHVAACYNHGPFLTALLANDIFTSLIEQKDSKFLWTPLWFAVVHDSADAYEVLINAGADISGVDKGG